MNLTGSPTFGGRIRIVGDPGEGCTSDPYRQFNTAAFQGPLVGSVGLESANNYLFGCFLSVLDISVARNIRLGGSRVLQLRLDSFNAPNQAIITGRQQSVTPGQSERSRDGTEPAAPARWNAEPGAGEAEQRGLRRGQRLADATQPAGVHPLLVLRPLVRTRSG